MSTSSHESSESTLHKLSMMRRFRALGCVREAWVMIFLSKLISHCNCLIFRLFPTTNKGVKRNAQGGKGASSTEGRASTSKITVKVCI